MPAAGPATLSAFDQREWIPFGRIALDRVLQIFGRAVPRLGFWRIHGHRKARAAALKPHLRPVPVERRRCAERDIAGVMHFEMPGAGTCRGPSGFGPAVDHHRLVAPTRLGEPRPLGRREHVVRILELARAGDDPVRRDSHRIIEIAVLEIEFLGEVGQRVPAAKVVVDGHARVPLGDRVDRAVRCIHPAGTATPRLLGHGVVVVDAEHRRGTVCERHWKTDQRARVADYGLYDSGFLASNQADRVERHSVGEPARCGVARKSAARVRPVSVLLEVQPQCAECLRAVVRVADLDRAGDCVRRRIERRADPIVGAVLPILRSRTPVRRAKECRRLPRVERRESLERIVGTSGRCGGQERQRAENAKAQNVTRTHAGSSRWDRLARG